MASVGRHVNCMEMQPQHRHQPDIFGQFHSPLMAYKLEFCFFGKWFGSLMETITYRMCTVAGTRHYHKQTPPQHKQRMKFITNRTLQYECLQQSGFRG